MKPSKRIMTIKFKTSSKAGGVFLLRTDWLEYLFNVDAGTFDNHRVA